MSFVPTVGEILPEETGGMRGLQAAVSYWTEGECSAEEWLRGLKESWGPSGLAMRRGSEVLGTVIFGPPESLPRAGRYPLEPSDADAVLLAYVSGDRRARKHLLVRMCKELRHRNIAIVEAIASDFGVPHHVATGFLLENGWHPVRRFRYRGYPHTLVRVDLGSAVEAGWLARDIIGRVRLPKLKGSSPVPGGAMIQVQTSSQNGKTAVLTAEIPTGVVA